MKQNATVWLVLGLLYRRGNFNGSWDDVICDAIRCRILEIALSLDLDGAQLAARSADHD